MPKRRQRRRQAERSPEDERASDLDFEHSLRPPWISDELVEDTIRVWSKQYGRPISVTEAVEICANVRRLAECLCEITRDNEAKSETESPKKPVPERLVPG